MIWSTGNPDFSEKLSAVIESSLHGSFPFGVKKKVFGGSKERS